MGRKTGKFEILTNFGFLNKFGHLELTQRAAGVSKKSEISAKRGKEKVKNNEGAFFFHCFTSSGWQLSTLLTSGSTG